MSDNLEHDLIVLRLHWLAGNLNDLIAKATKARSGPREIVAEIAKAELLERSARTTERRLRDAKIGRVKPMSEFDWAWPRAIDREAIEKALALDFLSDDANVILAGPQGVGKSVIAKKNRPQRRHGRPHGAIDDGGAARRRSRTTGKLTPARKPAASLC